MNEELVKEWVDKAEDSQEVGLNRYTDGALVFFPVGLYSSSDPAFLFSQVLTGEG